MAFHLFRSNEISSNADGTVQFIELKEAFGGTNEIFWGSQSISVTRMGETTHTFAFGANLPMMNTAGKLVLLATSGFQAVTGIAPDYVIPNGFLFVAGGTVNFAGVSAVTYGALPTSTNNSLNTSSTSGTATASTESVNSPTNFAGATGTVPATASPPPNAS